MATFYDTVNTTLAGDFCPQSPALLEVSYQEQSQQKDHEIKRLTAENDRLSAENTHITQLYNDSLVEIEQLRMEIALLNKKDGEHKYKIAEAVWNVFSPYFTQNDKTTVKQEIASQQSAWWYLEYDVLSIRKGHIKEFLYFLRSHMNRTHLEMLRAANNIKARNELRDFLMENIRLYVSGRFFKLDADSLRHPLLEVFPPFKL